MRQGSPLPEARRARVLSIIAAAAVVAAAGCSPATTGGVAAGGTATGEIATGGGALVGPFNGSQIGATMVVTAVDRTTGRPLPGATVFLGQDGNLAAAQTQTTNAQGQATFIGLTGPQTVTATIAVSDEGATQVRTVTMAGVNARSVNVSLDAPSENGFLDVLTVTNFQGPGNFFDTNADGITSATAFTFRAGRPFTFVFQDLPAGDFTPQNGGALVAQPAVTDGELRSLTINQPAVPAVTPFGAGQVSFGAPFTTGIATVVVDCVAETTGEPQEFSVGGGTIVNDGSASPRTHTAGIVRVPGVTQVGVVFLGIEGRDAGIAVRLISAAGGALPNVTLPSPPVITSPSEGAVGVGVRPAVTFTAPAGTDYVRIEFDDGGSRLWQVFLPGTASSFSVPALPASVAANELQPGVPVEISVHAIFAPGTPDFDALDFTPFERSLTDFERGRNLVNVTP